MGLGISPNTARVRVRLGLAGASLAVASLAGGLDAGAISVPAITLTLGVATEYDLRPHLPPGTPTPGAWALASTSAALPASCRIRADGFLLCDGTGSATVVSGLRVRYESLDDYHTVVIHPSATGSRDYSKAIYPPAGAYPAGTFATSPDDASMRSQAIATYADGSASVMIVAGTADMTAGAPKSIRLRRATSQSGANLGGAAFAALSSVSFDVTGDITGSCSISSFATIPVTRWATPNSVCGRWRAKVSGQQALELVVHATAHVNGRVDIRAWACLARVAGVSTSSAQIPFIVRYAATLSVNGSVVYTHPLQMHRPNAAWSWYGSVGGAKDFTTVDALVDLKRCTAYPDYEQPIRESGDSSNKGLVQFDALGYTPLGIGDHPPNMSAGGDKNSIGYLNRSGDAAYVSSGDPRAARAAVVSTRSAAAFPILWHDDDTGESIDIDTLGSKGTQTGQGVAAGEINWATGVAVSAGAYRRTLFASDGGPHWYVATNSGTTGATQPTHLAGTVSDGAVSWQYLEPAAKDWSGAHSPSLGLVAFSIEPDPMFIDLAYGAYFVSHVFPSAADRGVTGDVLRFYLQVRGAAWSLRHLAAFFRVAPNGYPNKARAETTLLNNANALVAEWDIASNPYDIITNLTPTFSEETAGAGAGAGTNNGRPGHNVNVWMSQYLSDVWCRIVRMGVLGPTAQAAARSAANYAARYTINRILTSADWRLWPAAVPIGKVPQHQGSLASVSPEPSIAAMDAWYFTGAAISSTELLQDDGTFPAERNLYVAVGGSGAWPPHYMKHAVSSAAEAGCVDGAWSAWEKLSTVSNWNTITSTNVDVRWNGRPR
jgi:hypothetical protein